VALVKTSAVEAITEQISADYKKRTGIEATMFVSRPAAGAMIIKA
jgi:galactokinase